MTSMLLIHGAILGLALATGLGFLAVRRQSAGPLQGARILAGVAALLLIAVLVRRGIALDKAPIVSRFDTHLLVSLLLIGAALGLDLLRSMPILTIGALPLALASLILAAATGEPQDPAAPFASTPVAGVHAVLILLSYVAFAVAFVTSLLYLIEQRQLKSHGAPAALGMMPSLETSYRMTRRSVVAGVILLTGGILCGYLYAREKLTPGWRMDAKIIVTTGVWLGFLIVAVLSVVPSFKGRRTAVTSALCFVISMAASWISSFWSGFHRY
ncbi:MAG TPA: cytochrome c biogenesis protein CcsA [Planctomycetota bacterium]|nr:cytochrome c biogenesis protein CcsA [Planctomycetota bacterium]